MVIVNRREYFFEVGMIHMNGRMYDSKLGRFLSPDNYIQDPFNTQSYNRYGYVWNNPLSYNDPSGEWFISSLIVAAFSYLKGAHDNKDENGNWNWDPLSWEDVPALGVATRGNFDQGGVHISVQPTITPTGASDPLPIGPTVDWDVDFGNPVNRDSGGGIQNSGKLFDEVIQTMYEVKEFSSDFGGAALDFYRAYSEMREANWRNSDKYFHMKANFNATLRGPGGKYFAEHFSNLREIWDQRVKRYPRWDSILDQKANKYGRNHAELFLKYPYIIRYPDRFRPIGLPEKY